jgi:hypothetical protein
MKWKVQILKLKLLIMLKHSYEILCFIFLCVLVFIYLYENNLHKNYYDTLEVSAYFILLL